MKSLEQQIILLDHELLPLYGFRSIADYETIITIGILERCPNFLSLLNQALSRLIDVYPVKKFNLHKTNHQIETCTQAFNILIQCLEISEIPHTVWTELHQRKTIRYLRLSQKNKTLELYITKMAEKRSNSQIENNIESIGKKEIVQNDLNISKRSTSTITYNDILGAVSNFSEEEYRFPLYNRVLRSKTFILDFTDFFVNKCFGSIHVSLSDDIPKDIADNVTCSTVTTNGKIKIGYLSECDLLPEHAILPYYYSCFPIFKLKLHFKKGFHTNSGMVIIHVTDVNLNHKMHEKLISYNGHIEIPWVGELSKYRWMSTNTSKPIDVVHHRWDDWKHIPDDIESNHQMTVKLNQMSKLNFQTCPFVQLDELKNMLMGYCRGRNFSQSTTLSFLYFFECSEPNRALNLIGSREINNITNQSYLYKNQLIIQTKIVRCHDTLTNFQIRFKNPIERPIDLKLLLTQNVILSFTKIDDHTFCANELGQYKHLNIIGNIHNHFELMISIPFDLTDQLDQLLGSVEMIYDGYYWSQLDRRHLALKNPPDAIIDLTTFEFEKIYNKKDHNVICPQCHQNPIEIVICDNDCGTYSCEKCKIEFYEDRDNHIYCCGHQPHCGCCNIDKLVRQSKIKLQLKKTT